MRQGKVFTADGTRLQLTDKMGLRLFVAGHHQQAGRVLIQPMDNAGTRHMGQFRIAVKQPVQQGALPVARPRMRDQAGRLADTFTVGGSEERRVGKGCDSECRSRWWPDTCKNKKESTSRK